MFHWRPYPEGLVAQCWSESSSSLAQMWDIQRGNLHCLPIFPKPIVQVLAEARRRFCVVEEF